MNYENYVLYQRKLINSAENRHLRLPLPPPELFFNDSVPKGIAQNVTQVCFKTKLSQPIEFRRPYIIPTYYELKHKLLLDLTNKFF